MKCVICKNGDMKPGYVKTLLGGASLDLVVKQVPALVCDNCGEFYLESETVKQLEKIKQEAIDRGVQTEVINLSV